MLCYLGFFSLIIASLLSFFAKVRSSFFCISMCIAILGLAYLINDFTLEAVYLSSHKNLNLLYKISGIWTTNQGSMLLWVWVLSCYLYCFYLLTKNCQVKTCTINVQSYVQAVFLLFIIFAANPFVKLTVSPTDGLGLNPVLQDIALSVHPPTLYLGYVGFSLCFSCAIAILISQEFTKESFELLNKLHLVSFALLTVGVGLGAWWAYRELGWSGFWSWDPVENISLMPWLLSLASIHALFAARKYQQLRLSAILLSILSFLSGVFGTLVVRTGFLDSLHTFANNQEQIFYFLCLFCVLTFVSIGVFFAKASKVQFTKGKANKAVWLMVLNVTVCAFLFLTIIISIAFGLFTKIWQNTDIYFKPQFYNQIFALGAILLTIGVPIFPIFSAGQFFARYRFSVILSALALIYILQSLISIICGLICFFGFFLIFTTTEHYFRTIPKITITQILTTTKNAFYLSHLSLGIFLVGVSIFSSFSSNASQYLKPGQEITVGNSTITLKGYQEVKNVNFEGLRAIFEVSGKILKPELRFYKKENITNAESDTLHGIFSDLMIVISGIDKDLGIATEIYNRKGIQIIWVSFLVLFLGCVLKISNIIKKCT